MGSGQIPARVRGQRSGVRGIPILKSRGFDQDALCVGLRPRRTIFFSSPLMNSGACTSKTVGESLFSLTNQVQGARSEVGSEEQVQGGRSQVGSVDVESAVRRDIRRPCFKPTNARHELLVTSDL